VISQVERPTSLLPKNAGSVLSTAYADAIPRNLLLNVSVSCLVAKSRLLLRVWKEMRFGQP
jgi:hypothetical protein